MENTNAESRNKTRVIIHNNSKITQYLDADGRMESAVFYTKDFKWTATREECPSNSTGVTYVMKTDPIDEICGHRN